MLYNLIRCKMVNGFERYTKMPITLKAAFWFSICTFLQKGISFITVPIFTRMMSVSDYGRVTLFQSWLQIIIVVCTLNVTYGGFYNGMIKYSDDKDGYTTSVWSLTTLMIIFWTIIYFIFAPTLNKIFGFNTIISLLMLVDIYAQSLFAIWITRQKYEFNYKKQTILTIIVALVAPLLGIFFVINLSDKAIGRILGFVIAYIIGGIYASISIFKKNRKLVNLDYWKFTLLYCIPLIPHFISQSILSQSDRLMINYFIGVKEAGIYGFAYNIAFLTMIFINSINNSFLPWLYQKMQVNDYDNIRNVTNTLLLFVSSLICVISLFTPEIIYIMGGDRYLDAVSIMPILSVSVYFVFLYGLFCNIQLYFEKNMYVMVGSLSSGILNIVLNYIFIKSFGFSVAAYTTLACYIILSIVHYIFMKKICKKKNINKKIYDVKFILIISSCVTLFTAVEFILFKNNILRYIVITIIFVWGVRNKEKIKQIISKIKQR